MTPDETIAQPPTWQTEISDEEIFLTYNGPVFKGVQAGILFPSDQFPLELIRQMLGELNGVAQLRADLARERERSDIAEGCLASVRKFQAEEKTRADALEKELAEQITVAAYWGKRCDQEKDDRAVAESRLAAMQKHADALAKALSESHALMQSVGTENDSEEDLGAMAELEKLSGRSTAALAAYRAFTAEREKETKP